MLVNRPHRGFAFVEFEDADDAVEAIDNMHLSELYGKVLKVTRSKPIRIREGSAAARAGFLSQAFNSHRPS